MESCSLKLTDEFVDEIVERWSAPRGMVRSADGQGLVLPYYVPSFVEDEAAAAAWRTRRQPRLPQRRRRRRRL